MGGGIYIFNVFNYVRMNVLMLLGGVCLGVFKVVVVLIDGFLVNVILMKMRVQELYVDNVEVYVIGIGNVVVIINIEFFDIVSDFDVYYLYIVDMFQYFCVLVFEFVFKLGIKKIFSLYQFLVFVLYNRIYMYMQMIFVNIKEYLINYVLF